MDLPFRERLAELEHRFGKFSVASTDRVRVAGGLKTGFAVNVDDSASIFGSGGIAGLGACCFDDGSCIFESYSSCLEQETLSR